MTGYPELFLNISDKCMQFSLSILNAVGHETDILNSPEPKGPLRGRAAGWPHYTSD